MVLLDKEIKEETLQTLVVVEKLLAAEAVALAQLDKMPGQVVVHGHIIQEPEVMACKTALAELPYGIPVVVVVVDSLYPQICLETMD
jgi:hypothetical protein